MRARERPRSARWRTSSSSVRERSPRPDRRRSDRRRSRETVRSACPSSESRKRPSSSVRSTVATTRSNDGRSRDTGRRLRDVVAAAPLVTALVAVHDGEDYVRGCAREHPRSDRHGCRGRGRRRRVRGRDSADPRELDDTRLRVLRNEQRRARRLAEPRAGRARGRTSPLDADDVAHAAAGWSASSTHPLEHRLLRSSDRRCWRCDAGRAGHACTRCPSIRLGPLARALQLTVLPPDRARRPRSSTGSGSGTTSATRRARTTTCGRACSRLAEGDNLSEPLVLYRVHPEQASQRRRELQRECQLRVVRGMTWESYRAVLHGGGAGTANRCRRATAPGRRGRCGRRYLRPSTRSSNGGPHFRPEPPATSARVGQAASRHGTCTQITGRCTPASTRASSDTSSGRRRRTPARLPPSASARPRRPARARARPGWRPHPTSLSRPFAWRGLPRADAVPRAAPRPHRRAGGGRPTPCTRQGPVAPETWRVEPNDHAVLLRGLGPRARAVDSSARLPRHPGFVPAATEIRPSVVVVRAGNLSPRQAAIAWVRAEGRADVLSSRATTRGRERLRRTVKGTVVPPGSRCPSHILPTGKLAATDDRARRRTHASTSSRTPSTSKGRRGCRRTGGTPARVAPALGAGPTTWRPLRRAARAGEGPGRADPRRRGGRRPGSCHPGRRGAGGAGSGVGEELGVRLALVGDATDRIVEP